MAKSKKARDTSHSRHAQLRVSVSLNSQRLISAYNFFETLDTSTG